MISWVEVAAAAAAAIDASFAKVVSESDVAIEGVQSLLNVSRVSPSDWSWNEL